MSDARSSRKKTRVRRDGGAAILEFALIALVLYFVIAATLDLGRQMLYAQTAQGAVNLLAREISRAELPATGITLSEEMSADTITKTIYDPRWLVIDLDADVPTGVSLDDFFATLPVVNQSLRALMIFDPVQLGGSVRNLMRVPGALWVDPNGNLTVKVPQVVARDGDGTETIVIRDFVEEVTDPDGNSFFPVAPTSPEKSGLVAVRINVPFQAAAMSGFQTAADGPYAPNLDNAISANDAGVTVLNAPAGSSADGVSQIGTYSGSFGLGVQQSLAKELRPYRKLITVQAVFRREVFAS